MRAKSPSLTVIRLTCKTACKSNCKIKGLPSIWPALFQHMLTPGVFCLAWGDIRRLSSMSASLQAAAQPFQQQQHFLQEQSSAPAKTSDQPALTMFWNIFPSKAWFKVPSFCLYAVILFAGDLPQLLIWFSPYVRLSREPVTINYQGVGGLCAPRDDRRCRSEACTLAGVTQHLTNLGCTPCSTRGLLLTCDNWLCSQK